MERITIDPISRAMQEAAELSWESGSSGGASAETSVAPAGFPGYQVLKQIRAGGQAVVYLGVEEATGLRVAIKMFRTSAAPSPKDLYRFEREVEALQGLCHPCITRILQASTGDGADGARPYIVMEYVPGWNLDDYFCEHDLDVRATMRLFSRIAGAVYAAHQKGVIHRDIKPSNIRVDHNGEPHVFDFGLAKMGAPEAGAGAGGAGAGPDATMTETGQFLGTLYWASPEQAEGRVPDVDVRTDVYSLGMVLYHMLTGEVAFERGGSMRDALNRIATAEPIPLRRWRREIDDDVETIVMKCLAKDRSRRYGTAGEVVEDVERWVAGRAILAKRDSVGYVVGKFVRRHRHTCALVVGAVLLMLGLILGYTRYERGLRAGQEDAAALMVALFGAESVLNGPPDAAEYSRTIDKLISVANQVRPGADNVLYVFRTAIAERCEQCGRSESAYEQSMLAAAAARRRFGGQSPELATALAALGRRALDTGRDAEAIRCADESITIAFSVGANTQVYASACGGRVWIALKLKDHATAERLTQELIRCVRLVDAGDDAGLAVSLKNGAELLYDASILPNVAPRRADALRLQALSLQREALEHATAAHKEDPKRRAHNLNSLAVLLRETGNFEEAAALASEALDIRKLAIEPGTLEAVYLYASYETLGVIRMYQDRLVEARDLLRRAYEGLTRGNVPAYVETRRGIASHLGRLYDRWEQDDPDGDPVDPTETAAFWYGKALE